MYPHVAKEMPSAPPTYMETINNAQHQAPPYPNPHFNQQQAPQLMQPQVIVVQTGIPPLGPRPIQLICPTCKIEVQSSVEEESSSSAYICCMLLFIIGCVLCSCLPFCMDNFKVYKHSCPNCRAFIGIYKE